MKSIFSKKISVGPCIVAVLISIGGTYWVSSVLGNGQSISSSNPEKGSLACNYEIKRLEGYRYIRPLMFVEDECESEGLTLIKQRVTKLIDELKGSGDLISASVYLKSYTKNEWMGINENEKFSPGSLLKVPVLIAFLKMNEKRPGILDQTLAYSHPFPSNKTVAFLSNQIILGHKYTVRDLLTYMIAYSDNNATNLLNTIIDVNVFKKIFTDFGLEAPEWNSSNYPISSKDYSLFIRALYNASYLSIEDSELATELLAKSDFKMGLAKDLPDYLRIAHKFGEGGNSNEPEVSESAIIYLENKPYSLTVMTKGKEKQRLAQILSQISDVVFQNM